MSIQVNVVLNRTVVVDSDHVHRNDHTQPTLSLLCLQKCLKLAETSVVDTGISEQNKLYKNIFKMSTTMY